MTGTYRFQTISDDGIRVLVNGTVMIENWTLHGSTTNTGGGINLVAGQKVQIVVEYFDNTRNAVARLRWQTPGNASFVNVPKDRQYPP